MSSLGDLDVVALDQRVGEELLAHPLDLGSGRVRIGSVELEVDDAADARFADGEAELAERRLHRLTLRVEDACLRPDEAAAREQLERMCRHLLANPLIESYEIEVVDE